MARSGGGSEARAGRVLQAAEFKDGALAVMRRVRDTGVAVTVTSHGRPLVRIVPPRDDEGEPAGHGCMLGSCELRVSEVVAFPTRAQ